MSYRGEVLVAILNDPLDLVILRERGWYRIPVRSVEKWLKHAWPPRWIAFYQTKIFGADAYAIRYFTEVDSILQVPRYQLFPAEPHDRRSERRYYQLILKPLQDLPQPVVSASRRRIVFIPTSMQKLAQATEINDLYIGSNLEEIMWVELRRREIPAQREEFVVVNRENYALDFAIYCSSGKIDVETDGDAWHANPEKAALDNRRDNSLETAGWSVLRFNTHQIQEEMSDYCIPTIIHGVNRLGGIDTGTLAPRKIDPSVPPGTRQLNLFEDVK